MNNKKVFHVTVIADLSEREWQILATATRLTTARARSYTFDAPSTAQADIYLVDGDDPQAQVRWNALRRQYSAPAIFLVSNPEPSSGRREFRVPMVPSCLLSLVNLLDEVTVQEMHYMPELNIGQEGTLTSAPASSDIIDKKGEFSALVVDDSTTVQAQVGLGLKMFGANADYAGTAEEAFKLLEKNQYDVAFLDVMLPGGVDGYQICKAIKKQSRSKDTVVIMLTGKSSTFDRVRASLAGCDAFLSKPVQNAVFQETLRKYLQVPDSLRVGETVAAK